jgi:hypothetical protein
MKNDVQPFATTDVFRKTMNVDVWQMVDLIKVGAGLSGTIASHKTLTLVVGMTNWGITIYYHFKLKKKSSMILDLISIQQVQDK